MKRIILLLFLTLILLPLNVKALSVSESNIIIDKGNSKTVDLYAEVDTEVTEISFTMVYTSYDVPASFSAETGLNEQLSGNTHTIILATPTSGKIKLGTVKINAINNPTGTAGTINIHGAKATDVEGQNITLDTKIIDVTIKKEEITEETPDTPDNTAPNVQEETPQIKEEPKKEIKDEKEEETQKLNLLEKIESSKVNIKLKDGVYEYTVKIKEDVKELDLKPIVKDEKYKVEITSQKINELKNNQIIITVKDEKITEEYKINVKIAKNVEIDDTKFKTTYKYKGKWITTIIVLSIVLLSGLLLTKKK